MNPMGHGVIVNPQCMLLTDRQVALLVAIFNHRGGDLGYILHKAQQYLEWLQEGP